MSETPMVEAVARAICKAEGIDPDFRDEILSARGGSPQWRYEIDTARAAIEAIRNHTFGDSFIIRHGSEPTAILKGDVPQLVLRHLIDLAMAENAALAVPEEGREP